MTSGGELHLGIDRVRADPLRQGARYLVDEVRQIGEARGDERRRSGGRVAEEPDQVQLGGVVQGRRPAEVHPAAQRIHDGVDQRRASALPDGIRHRADHGLGAIEEHRLLCREVVEHGLLGDLARRRDPGDRHVVEAVNQEHGCCHVRDPLANLPLLALAQGLARAGGIVGIPRVDLEDRIHVEIAGRRHADQSTPKFESCYV